MRYLLIKNGVVQDCIEADAVFVAALTGWDAIVPTETAGMGWSYADGNFNAPSPDPILPAAPLVRLTKLGFRNRFTQAEKAAIEFACLDNPSGTMQSRQLAANLRATLADQRDARYIEIDPLTVAGIQTKAGLQMLETVGIIGAGRAVAIFNAPVQPSEAWTD